MCGLLRGKFCVMWCELWLLRGKFWLMMGKFWQLRGKSWLLMSKFLPRVARHRLYNHLHLREIVFHVGNPLDAKGFP